MVGGDVVANLQGYLTADALNQRGSLRIRLDVGTSQYLNAVHISLSYGRHYHIVVYLEVLGHLDLGHFA